MKLRMSQTLGLLNRAPCARLLRWELSVCLALCGVAGSGCEGGQTSPKKAASAATQRPKPVQTARVEQRLLERSIAALGSFEAYDQSTVGARAAGGLQKLEVDLGSTVKAGDLMAVIDPTDYQLRVQQAQAALAAARALLGLPAEGTNDKVEPEETSTVKLARAVLEEAKVNRDRVRKLAEDGVLPKSDLDTVEAAYQVAVNRYQDSQEEVRRRQATVAQRRVELEIARQDLADTRVLAPFDGMVQARRARVGEYLSEGSPVVTVVRMDPLRLRLEVSERESSMIRLEQEIRVRLEGDATIRTGRVQRISPAIQEQNRMLVVEADLPNDGSIHPGLFARAAIQVDNGAAAMVIPTRALVTFAGLEKVFVVKDGKALEKVVVTGRRGPDWVEVISGLVAEDVVVLDPGNLQTQQPVMVKL